MKEAYYFSHDANARQDEKILMLRADHGWEGYGIYWALVEMMFESSDTSLHHNKIKGIAVSYNIDITLLEAVINTCITENLFVSNGDTFWSESLLRRKSIYKESKQKKSEAGKKGMQKRWANKQSDNTVITDDNTVITKDNKGKEKKVKEIKEKETKKEYADFVTLTEDEYSKLLEKFGEEDTKDRIERLSFYKGSKGAKYKSDYMTILNWAKKEEKSKPKPVAQPRRQEENKSVLAGFWEE